MNPETKHVVSKMKPGKINNSVKLTMTLSRFVMRAGDPPLPAPEHSLKVTGSSTAQGADVTQ